MLKFNTLVPQVTELMKCFVDKKDDDAMIKICCEFIRLNLENAPVTQIKKLFRTSLYQLKLSTYRQELILTMMKNQYLTAEQKLANDMKKIPKIIKDLQQTIETMSDAAQEHFKKELQKTFIPRESLVFLQEIDTMITESTAQPPPKKRKVRVENDETMENVLDVSTCSLFDLLS
jgi:hypothetical protein